MPTNGIGGFLVFVRQSDSYRAVGWLDTVLVLVLGSEKSLENGINKFRRIFQFQKHFFQVLAFFGVKVTEAKPSLVNKQCVVYEFQCNSCDSNYIGYTSRHLNLRIDEHKYSVIGKHVDSFVYLHLHVILMYFHISFPLYNAIELIVIYI